MTASLSSCLSFHLLTRIFHSNSRSCKLTLLLQHLTLLVLTLIASGASADALARAQRTELNEVDIDGEEFSPDQYHIQGQDSIEKKHQIKTMTQQWSYFAWNGMI